MKISLGDQLVEYRYKHKPKLTQMKMVRLLGGCSYESYRKWELGITEPNEKNAKRIVEFLKQNSG